MNVNVTANFCDIENNVILNAGEYNINKFYFTFTPEYLTEYVKKALFTTKNGEVYEMVIENDQCDIPNEILMNSGTYTFGVYAYTLQNDELILRYSPEPTHFYVNLGSYKESTDTPTKPTPDEFEQYYQAMQTLIANTKPEFKEYIDNEFITINQKVDSKIEEADEKIVEVNNKLDEADNKLNEMDSSIERASRLDIDVEKIDKTTTVSITKQDGTTKNENIRDGYDLEYRWDGTALGIKREDESEFSYSQLKGDCEFATFDIDLDTGELIMYKTSNMLIDFELDEETGEFFVVIPRKEGDN